MVMSQIKTLYKKNGSKVQKWTIERSGDSYRSIEGFVDGAMTTSEWTVATPKNIGRSNETSGGEQAINQVEAKIKLKLNKGYTTDPSGIVENFRFEPMLAHKYEDQMKKITPYLVDDNTCLLGLEPAVFCQPKLDGMRCNAVLEPIHQHAEDVFLYSRQGKPIHSAPHIANALLPILELNPSITLDGELYNHGLKDDFNTIISHVRKTKPTADDLVQSANVIQYHIYDMYDSDHPEMTFSERNKWIIANLTGIPGVVIVSTAPVFTQAKMDEMYGIYREQGYEGQMVRLDCPYEQKRSNCLLKRKEFQDSEYEILDIIEGIGNRSGGMGKFILKAGTETFESNGLGNMVYYKELLENKAAYIGQMATVRYQNLTPRGVPRFPCVHSIRDFE